jgi:hypothetical protein
VRAWGYELRRSSAATAPPCFRRYAMGMGLLVDQRMAESLPRQNGDRTGRQRIVVADSSSGQCAVDAQLHHTWRFFNMKKKEERRQAGDSDAPYHESTTTLGLLLLGLMGLCEEDGA